MFIADVLNLHTILLQLLMWLSWVFHSSNPQPECIRADIGLALTYRMVMIFRAPLYWGELPLIISIQYPSGIAVIFIVAGFWIFIRFSDANACLVREFKKAKGK